ncbi:ATP-binding protein [Schaalia cardiffensis]|uniref:ATP-binding protein n=1 Tax=Schaalia cardiffensis TaxID=181487 RepID=UPI0018E804A8|nr:ATP-binding protein [Schaalia cardiffensis]MBJ2329796.1 ATP-binding protein [Schaalia cardiffensis]
MESIAAVSSRTAPPDPSITRAVGTHHELRTALGDIVDNAIDAGAENILIRFLTEDDRIEGIYIIDDGTGMDEKTIDAAMIFARKRDYGESALGYFGLGLKAASLSQATILEIYSHSLGSVPVGRRISRDEPTRIEILDPAQAEAEMKRRRAMIPRTESSHGTIVYWRAPRMTLNATSTAELRTWLSEKIEELRAYLGLTFHRILESGGIRLGIDEFELERDEPGAPRNVDPIDPLSLAALACRPAQLYGDCAGANFTATAVLVADAIRNARGFIAAARVSPVTDGQGFYVYRNDRLLQIGGWNSMADENGAADYSRLRVAIDIDSRLLDHVEINPEKSGTVFDADLISSLRSARVSDGRALGDLLAEAAELARTSKTRERRPIEMVEVGTGIGRAVYDAIADAVDFTSDEPVGIRWKRLREGKLVEVRRETGVIYLNDRYRTILSDSTDPNDAPLLKTLIYLLYGGFFEGSYLGPREKLKIEAWNSIIDAALEDEIRRRKERDGA